ncbi:DUF4331 family protein [Stieleria tagensis]|uniref:DUF4331 family protein n=1 Tax=Stieleria tagensis TaxID=2956795 RepID=UPI00209A9BC0|nr:DUF4331 family protein [Stieleria tagensis]
MFVAISSLSAADHLDSPSVQNDGRLDINDIYAFQSPQNADNVVLIATVNPAAGVFSPTDFSANGNYEFNIDQNGDAVADLSYVFTFNRTRRGRQSYLVRRNGSVYASGQTGQTVTTSGGAKIHAALFEDPFFFDLQGFQNGFQFTGDDFFAGLNVSAIVLEIPRTELGPDNVGFWVRTTDGGVPFDRMGRPAINTVLISSGSKDLFNISAPANDPANFGAQVANTIATLNGGDTATAQALTAILLPDVLTVDTSSSAGFLNGRQLVDDVIDAELNLLTNGGVTTDGVDANDVDFPVGFPYLASPN